MCGIAGYINSIKGFDETQSVNVLKDFCNILKIEFRTQKVIGMI